MFRPLLLCSFTLLAACTQRNAAQVELKGHERFTQGAVSTASYAPPAQLNPTSYTTPSHAPMAPSTGDTVATASISSIGVSDVPAPTKTAAAPKFTPAPAASPVQPISPAPASKLAPAAGKSSKNPWTGRSREVVLKNASDQPYTTPEKPSAVSAGYIWPVSSKKVVSKFGPKGKGKVNEGINIASTNGEPVWAAADGEVVYAANELQGYGNMVLIKHDGNQTTTYAHLGRIIVDKYERVKQGDIIGYVGVSGKVKEPQLHFAVRDGNTPVDPVKFMKRNVASLQ